MRLWATRKVGIGPTPTIHRTINTQSIQSHLQYPNSDFKQPDLRLLYVGTYRSGQRNFTGDSLW